jgi:hypothetical protein
VGSSKGTILNKLSPISETPIQFVFVPRIRISCHGAPPTAACAAFIKESRMKFASASKLDRKSGVRWGERGAPVFTYRSCFASRLRTSTATVALKRETVMTSRSARLA